MFIFSLRKPLEISYLPTYQGSSIHTDGREQTTFLAPRECFNVC